MATEIEFFDELQARLGGNLIDVELTYADFRVAFNNAVLTYRYKGNDESIHGYYVLTTIANTQTYTIDTDIDDIVTIFSASPSTSVLATTDPLYYTAIQEIFGGTTSGTISLIDYELMTQQLEVLQRYTISDIPFFFNRTRHELFFPKSITTANNFVIEVFRRMTDAEYRDHLWIKEYTLAECKIMLGRAYQKFSAISTPAGDNSLNGNELIQEGRDDKERLLNDIKNFVDSDVPGGGFITMG